MLSASWPSLDEPKTQVTERRETLRLVKFVLRMLADISLAVWTALQAGMFHGDMKEPNIVLSLAWNASFADTAALAEVSWHADGAATHEEAFGSKLWSWPPQSGEDGALSLPNVVVDNASWVLIDFDSATFVQPGTV